MSVPFSTRCKPVVPCPQPVLTIGFPQCQFPGPNTVVLANGACVDVVKLGQIISEFCPDFGLCSLGAAPLSTDGFEQVAGQLQTLGIDATQALTMLEQAGISVDDAGLTGGDLFVQ